MELGLVEPFGVYEGSVNSDVLGSGQPLKFSSITYEVVFRLMLNILLPYMVPTSVACPRNPKVAVCLGMAEMVAEQL